VALPSSPAPALTLRPAGPGDAPLLFTLFRCTRVAEASRWGWVGDQLTEFLDTQWQMEQRMHRTRYPEADDAIVLADGEPVGRLLVDRTNGRIFLVDLTLLPKARGKGIGTRLVRDLLVEAEFDGLPLRLSVPRGSRALGLLRRVGLEVVTASELTVGMAFSPASPLVSATG